ncbi:SDR family NAD(P)-dependent oxidoreductase [Streptomyces chartreusis]|uniref:SDR family NAD(P)-dependent oxidoreductase n=1 Tax=Streptomyces chartreusis TaxID=1969 RepID=UPI00367837C3
MSSDIPPVNSFTGASTAQQVLTGIDLSGRRAIVTGASSGIGIETARALVSAGAEVTLAVRNTAMGEQVAADLATATGRGKPKVAQLDLSELSSVVAFVDAWSGPLHILINNAGVMALPETRIGEDWEAQFATNHLGHFALTTGLHAAMTRADDARVVSVSSAGHIRSNIDFDDIHYHRRPYDKWSAYGQSKTANILFAVEAARRWADDGITVNAVMPGGVRTNLQRHQSPAELEALYAQFGGINAIPWKTPEQGAATSVFVATSPQIKGVGGSCYENCAQAGPYRPETRTGVAAYALDGEAAQRLWRVSTAMLTA